MQTKGFEARRSIALWLLTLCGMVFFMVILGGLTRLTDSGLSMVEWQPFTLLPPMSEAEWQETFAKYRQSPEFNLVNSYMTVEDFKGIFWLEYIHRMWGRLIGFVFLLPFLWFLARRMLDRSLVRPLTVIFVLGALQGALGWFMVQSGLVDRPDVSHFRLAAHFFAALLILGAMLWVALDLLVPADARSDRNGASSALEPWLAGMLVLASVTMIWGAFVAGLDAGLIYNTFPLMNGHLVAPDAFLLEPWWYNIFESVAGVQFSHRVLAITLVGVVLVFWLRARRLSLDGRQRFVVNAVPVVALVQAGLGIATLVLAVPLALASLHQAVAVVLFALLVAGLNLNRKSGAHHDLLASAMPGHLRNT